MNKIRNTLVVALPLLLLVAAPARPYSKFEHEQLTYYAFELARQRVCEVTRPLGSCSGFGRVSPAQLGGVTRAVDYFSHPWRLVPAPEHCTDPDLVDDASDGCRKSLAAKCQNPEPPVYGSSQKRKACLDSIFEDTLNRVHERRNKRLWRLLAVHRNDEHFRQGAEEQYNKMHGRALEMAKDGEYALALVAEAVAIHFLQDGFAPGHLAAPRDQYGDSYAGSLHDRFNSKGLPIWVDGELCRAAEELLEPMCQAFGENGEKTAKARTASYRAEVTARKQRALAAPDMVGERAHESDQSERPEIKKSKQIEPGDLKGDLVKFVDEFCKPGEPSPTYPAFGDKQLLTGKPGSARHVKPGSAPANHRVSLLTLAVESILDVLEARQRPTPPLQLCFHPPSFGEPLSEGCGKGTDDRFWSPGLAIGRAQSEFSPGSVCWPCGQEELLFGFHTGPDRERSYTELPAGAHRVNGLQVAFSYVGEKRRRFEFAHDTFATEQYYVRDEKGALQTKVGRRAFGSAGYSLHYEKDHDLEASGAGLLYSYGIQHQDFDYYAALEPGIGYYSFPGGSSTRYRWSVRVGVGWSVVAGEVIVERGYELLPGGRLEKEWRPSVNLRLRIAPSWLWIPFKR